MDEKILNQKGRASIKKKLDLLGDMREGMLYNYTYMYFELIF